MDEKVGIEKPYDSKISQITASKMQKVPILPRKKKKNVLRKQTKRWQKLVGRFDSF